MLGNIEDEASAKTLGLAEMHNMPRDITSTSVAYHVARPSNALCHDSFLPSVGRTLPDWIRILLARFAKLLWRSGQ
jgi:hypothetical protein